MSAPQGATVVSPLTTLVVAGGATVAANAEVVEAFGLAAGTDLPHFDPILATLDGDANGALAIKAAIQVQNTIQQAAAILVRGGADELAATIKVVDELWDEVAAATGAAPLNLSDPVVIARIISEAAAALTPPVTINSAELDDAVDIIVQSNTAAAGTSGSGAALLEDLTQVASVANESAGQLADPSQDTSQTRDDYTGANLQGEIAAAPVEDVDGAESGDVINGTAAADLLQGFGGDDTLNGLAGSDTLDGGDGNDIINAGVGFDIITGGPGNDTIDGGFWYDNQSVEGTGDLDRVSYKLATAGVIVDLAGGPIVSGSQTGTATGNASVGSDTLVHVEGIIGSDFADQLFGGANDQVETFRGGGGDDLINGRTGTDRAEYFDATAGVTIHLAAGTVDGVAGGVGTDTLRAVEDIGGSAFDDTYDATGFGPSSTNAGSNGTFNSFRPGDGDDIIIGNGDTQIDYRNAQHGVTVNLSSSNATGTGTVNGGDGVGTDTFSGVVRVRGSYFADTLIGGQEIANASSTAEFFEGLGGNDLINGGSGFDYARYHSTDGVVTGVLVDNPLNPGGPQITVGIHVNMAAGIVIGDALQYGTDTLRSVEGIRATVLDDVYDARGYGPTSINARSRGFAIDEFEGGGGNDIIFGSGNTRISYQNALAGITVDLSDPDNGIVTAAAGAGVGNDILKGGISSVRATNFVDSLTGYDNLAAGSIQTFDGRRGDDFIDGKLGFDRAIYDQDSTVTSGITINLAAGTVTGNAAEIGNDTLRGIEGIFGTDFADTLNAAGFSSTSTNAGGAGGTTQAFNELEGAGGDDIITGNGNTRVAYTTATAGVRVTLTAGGAGSASAIDANGIDVVNASVGADTFVSGVTRVRGSNHDDIITGNSFTAPNPSSNGNNILEGSGGNDRLAGAGGNDTLNGGEWFDGVSVSGFADIDYADYSTASARVRVDLQAGTAVAIDGAGNPLPANATVGQDTLSFIEGVIGSVGNDQLFGGANDFFETFRGGGGNDTIDGRGGFDNAEYTDATGAVTIVLATGAVSGSGVGADTLLSVEFCVGLDARRYVRRERVRRDQHQCGLARHLQRVPWRRRR